jgi:pantetheine-phosphate adenylyltransferase
MKIGIYAGSFDPITLGHEDMIKRSLEIVDQLYISVGVNPDKKTLFSAEDRMDMMNESVNRLKLTDRVKVTTYKGLLVKHAEEIGAKILIRGLRAASDFDFEFSLHGANQKLDSSLQTIFLMAPEKFLFISSTMIKQIAQFGGPIDEFVSPYIAEKVRKKF